MPSIRVRDVEVDFPFDPYPAQAEYIASVMDTLNRSTQALLESPTGTGKTLCLLCAACAWVKQHRASAQADGFRLPVRQPSAKTVMGQPDPPAMLPMRIVYTSRTHAQLAQVIREFKKTTYATHFTMAVLGSREHLCVHNTVSKLTSAQSMTSGCAAVRADQQCRFYSKIQFLLSMPHRLRTLSGADDVLGSEDMAEKRPTTLLPPVHDIEDLAKSGRSVGFCPYYYERAVAKDADIVFLPYTYLFDPSVRKQLPFALEDCILIIDEAHNLPSVLSASANTNLPPLAIAQAMRELSVAIEMLRGEVRSGELDRERELQNATKEEGLSVWKLLLARLEEVIEVTATSQGKNIDALRAKMAGANGSSARLIVPVPPSAGGNGEVVLCGSSIFDLLRSVDLTIGNWRGNDVEGGLGEVLNQALGTLATSDAGCPGVQTLQQFLSNIFDAEGSNEEIDENCRVVLQSSTPSSSSHYKQPAQRGVSWTLGFWSLNTTSSMVRATQGTRALILTSGTLSPMDHFAAELGIPFDVTLVGRHVVGPQQVLCSILGKGPSGASLNASYAFRSSEEYRLALGYSIINVARNVPNGFLVFFPSYGAMHGGLELWKTTGGQQCDATVWSQMAELKSLFVEPTDGGELPLVIQNFQRCAEKDGPGGAILFAVCRGKISEGVDFSDKHGRCVMVVGIPYANQGDLFVRLKRQYITLSAPRRPKVRGKLFTGDDWYRQEALRSVNQAIGRVIRHKDDFGCVVLADPRYTQLVDGLSGWITASMERHETFGETYAAVAQFFHRWRKGSVRATARPVVEPHSDHKAGVGASAGAVVPPSAFQAQAFQEQETERRKAAVSAPSVASTAPPVAPPAHLKVAAPTPFVKQRVAPPPAQTPVSTAEFCELVKQRTSSESYAAFRSFLCEVGAMKKERLVSADDPDSTVKGGGASKKERDSEFITRFADFAKRVSVFFDTAYTTDFPEEKQKMLQTFIAFLPPVFQDLYLALLRKRQRDVKTE